MLPSAFVSYGATAPRCSFRSSGRSLCAPPRSPRQVTCYQAQIRSLDSAFREINAALTAAVVQQKPVYIRGAGGLATGMSGVRGGWMGRAGEEGLAHRGSMHGGVCGLVCLQMPRLAHPSVCGRPAGAPLPQAMHAGLSHAEALPSSPWEQWPTCLPACPRLHACSIPANLAAAMHPSFSPEPVPFSIPSPISAKGGPCALLSCRLTSRHRMAAFKEALTMSP